MSEVCNVHVQKCDKSPEGHMEFFIKICFLGREWGIRKRYSDFLHFDEYLRRTGISVDYRLPPKNWWSRFDPTLLATRLKALQLYMNALLSAAALGENSLVREFLEVDTINIKELRKAASFRRLHYFDRLHAVVEQTNRQMISINAAANLSSYNYAMRNASASNVRIRSNSALSQPLNRDRGGSGAISPPTRYMSFSLSPSKQQTIRAASRDRTAAQGALPSSLAFANSFSGGSHRKNPSGSDSERLRLSSQDTMGHIGALVEAAEDVLRRERFLREADGRFSDSISLFLVRLPTPAAAPLPSSRPSSERHSVSSSGSASGKLDRGSTVDRGSTDGGVMAPAEIAALLREPLHGMWELQQALDGCADSLFEASLHSQLMLSGDKELVYHFRSTKAKQRLLQNKTPSGNPSPTGSMAAAASPKLG